MHALDDLIATILFAAIILGSAIGGMALLAIFD